MLLRDIAALKRLKQEDGPNLVTQGSTELIHALLAHNHKSLHRRTGVKSQ